MAVDNMAIYNNLEEEVNTVCEDKGCADCSGVCVMKYAKDYIDACRQEEKREFAGGFDGIPTEDFKHYDQDVIVDSIAKTLAMCHECETYHSADCVINVVRSCFEHTLMGDKLDYPGNALGYLMKLQAETPLASDIMERYKEYKNS